MRHFHAYDVCGEIMCVDAHNYEVIASGALRFYAQDDSTIALFNWSNVVCVREEEDDDEGESAGIPPVFSGALN